MDFVTLLITIVLVGVLVTSGFLAAQAAVNIKEQGYETDEDLKKVHALAAGTASIAFIVAIASTIGGLIATFKTNKTWIGTMIAFLLALSAVASGAMAAYAASLAGRWIDINGTGNSGTASDGSDTSVGLVQVAKTNLVWASTTSFIAVAAVIAGLIFRSVTSKSKKEELIEMKVKTTAATTAAEEVVTKAIQSATPVVAPVVAVPA